MVGLRELRTHGGVAEPEMQRMDMLSLEVYEPL